MNRVAIIGAGKFAHSFTNALKDAEINIQCIISRNIKSAAGLAKFAGGVLNSDKLSDIPEEVNIIFITVPDSDIQSIAYQLAELDLIWNNKVVVHCSGALDSSLLEPVFIKGASTASFHIMQTFPSKEIVDVAGCYASIETDDDVTYKLLYDLACKLILRPFRLNREQKTAYHLAGVFACNFLTGNIFAASEIFSDDINIYNMLEPIITSTLKNIKISGAAHALSGPIDRGDIETIKRHLSIINNNDLLSSYISQSNILLGAAEKKYGRLSENHKKIKELLDSAGT